MIAPISSPRDAVGVCLLGDKLYAVGGYDGQQYIKDVESYDPIANEWTKVFPKFKFEPPHEISNIVVCATSKASDQPALTRNLIRAFASRWNIL